MSFKSVQNKIAKKSNVSKKAAAAILASASSSGSNLSGLASQYSGVASLAGISLPSGGSSSKVSMGIEVIKSLSFFERLVTKHDVFFDLEAPFGWDRGSDTLIINPKIYDIASKKWVTKGPYVIDGKPSLQSAHRNFLSNFSPRFSNSRV